jgi:magnesium transporter
LEVSSVGIVLQPNKLTIILGENTLPSFSNNAFRKTSSLNALVLKFFLYTVHHYFGHLKAIRQLAAELQGKLNISIENRYLLQMFALGESLVYYINALEANTSVLRKLRAISEKIGLTVDDGDLLDDILIEQQQCSSQTQIYSAVLSGLMDARGSIINNNMNVLLRNLTIINVVFMPLNLIAGIGGMSEYSMMTQHIDWRIAYALFLVAMMIFGWLTWLLLRRNLKLEVKPTRSILK